MFVNLVTYGSISLCASVFSYFERDMIENSTSFFLESMLSWTQIAVVARSSCGLSLITSQQRNKFQNLKTVWLLIMSRFCKYAVFSSEVWTLFSQHENVMASTLCWVHAIVHSTSNWVCMAKALLQIFQQLVLQQLLLIAKWMWVDFN